MGVPELEEESPKKKTKQSSKNKKGKKGKKKQKKGDSEQENTPSDEDGEGDVADYEVEKILDKKVESKRTGKKILYLVKWLGWEAKEDLTWEPLEHLQVIININNSHSTLSRQQHDINIII